MRERTYSLSAAAREIGIGRHALKRWMAQELGILVPRVRRGSKVLIRESDLEKIVARRRDARNACSFKTRPL